MELLKSGLGQQVSENLVVLIPFIRSIKSLLFFSVSKTLYLFRLHCEHIDKLEHMMYLCKTRRSTVSSTYLR